MNRFSRLERNVLRFINYRYDLPRHPHDSKRIIAIGERPLPSLADIQSRFRKRTSEAVAAAVQNLTTFQCIVRVYLYDKSDYAEVTLAPGERTRLPVAKPESGVYAFQITARGQNVIASFWPEWCRNFVIALLKTATEKTLHWIIAFLLGVFVSSLFGFDIRKIAVGPVETSPPSIQTRQK